MGNDKIQLFEDKRIRTAWDAEKEEWFFSIVDVVAVLTDQPDQRGASNYWAKLKQRLKEEGADQLLTNCQQLKLKSPKDGKRYYFYAMSLFEHGFFINVPDKFLQLPVVSCILRFDAGVVRCKIGYIAPHVCGSSVLRCTLCGTPLLF